MTVGQRITSLVSATLFIAGMSFAATVTPPTTSPPPSQPLAKVPAFSGLTVCHVTEAAEVCCTGKILGIAAKTAKVHVESAFSCGSEADGETSGHGEAKEGQVKGTLGFAEVCTLSPSMTTTTNLCGKEPMLFDPIVQISVDHADGTLQGYGVVRYLMVP